MQALRSHCRTTTATHLAYTFQKDSGVASVVSPHRQPGREEIRTPSESDHG